MPGFTKTQFIWINGNLVSWDAAQVHVTAHALQYGTGVFEGMRSYDTPDGPAIFRLDAHMKRFAVSAKHYEIDLGYSLEQLSDASLEVVRANGLENAYLRPLAFFDSYSFSVWPKDCPVTVAIIAVPGRAYLQGGPEHGVRVTVSSTSRPRVASTRRSCRRSSRRAVTTRIRCARFRRRSAVATTRRFC
jgi:branched-chain amino acid aminotransferase